MLVCLEDDYESPDEQSDKKKRDKDRRFQWNHGSQFITAGLLCLRNVIYRMQLRHIDVSDGRFTKHKQFDLLLSVNSLIQHFCETFQLIIYSPPPAACARRCC